MILPYRVEPPAESRPEVTEIHDFAHADPLLIVDDEPLAREGLRMLLAGDPEIAAIDEAKNGREAVAALSRAPPDLVFLDVQMPEMDGFRWSTRSAPEQMPAVVFVTAHDQYAIRAFEINAIDYLLKPVTRERFVQSLARAKARLQTPQTEDASRQILSLLETIASPPRDLKRMAVRTAGKTSFVDVEDVDWIGRRRTTSNCTSAARHICSTWR